MPVPDAQRLGEGPVHGPAAPEPCAEGILPLGDCLAALAWAYRAHDPPPPEWLVCGRLEGHPVEAVLVARAGRFVALLVGTNDPDDIGGRRPGLDLDVAAVPVDGFDVHAGAWAYAGPLLAWEPLAHASLLVGHSLGAAACALVSWRLGKPAVAVAPFKAFRGGTPAVRSLSLVDPDDAVPDWPLLGPWARPGATLSLSPSGAGPLDAHHVETYRRQLGGLAALDLVPWLEAERPEGKAP